MKISMGPGKGKRALNKSMKSSTKEATDEVTQKTYHSPSGRDSDNTTMVMVKGKWVKK